VKADFSGSIIGMRTLSEVYLLSAYPFVAGKGDKEEMNTWRKIEKMRI